MKKQFIAIFILAIVFICTQCAFAQGMNGYAIEKITPDTLNEGDTANIYLASYYSVVPYTGKNKIFIYYSNTNNLIFNETYEHLDSLPHYTVNGYQCIKFQYVIPQNYPCGNQPFISQGFGNPTVYINCLNDIKEYSNPIKDEYFYYNFGVYSFKVNLRTKEKTISLN